MTQIVNVEPRSNGAGEESTVDAIRSGDEATFAARVEPYRRELHVHCYRMLGSFDDADDLVQETLLRAWRGRGGFEGRSTLRAWLYRIATNACLEFLRLHRRREPARQAAPASDPSRAPSHARVPWLQPYPDRLLDEVAPRETEPDAVVVAKESIELAFLVAIQLLPPRQRAVLILRDVLGWSAAETASLLASGVAAVNSALQRARATLEQRRSAGSLGSAPLTDPSANDRALLRRYVDVVERADVAGFVELLREDARLTMPPQPDAVGREAVAALFRHAFGHAGLGDCRCVMTRANRQPAVACYLRRWGDPEYRALTLDVLRIEDGAVTEIAAFGPRLFPAFGLPPTL